MSAVMESTQPLVKIDGLAVTFFTPRGSVRALRNVSLEVGRGEVLGVVGESGCGKSTMAFAIMGYLPGTTRVEGTIQFEGQEIADMRPGELRELRGNRIAMVYQDPATSLNPTMRVGPQIEEVIREHLNLDAAASNHFIIPYSLDIGGFLADSVRILATSDPVLGTEYVQTGRRITWFELRRYVAQHPVKELTYVRAGGQSGPGGRTTEDGPLKSWKRRMLEKLLIFRPIGASSAGVCDW